MTELKYNDAIEVTEGFYQGMKGYVIYEQGENYLVKLITNIDDIENLEFIPEFIQVGLNKSVFTKI